MHELRNKTDASRYIALYGAAFAALLVFLLWKCKYGYANRDEAFYLTIPYRLFRGDNLLLHEWHLSQLSGFLLYPAVKAFLLLHGSTDHILLSFRYVFTAVWALAAFFLFIRLRAFSLAGSMFASLAFLIYTPFGIMALSYNSLGILLLVSGCTLAATAKTRLRLQYMTAGLLFAGAVLCSPHLLLLYLLLTMACIVAALLGKTRALSDWMWFSLGCGMLLIVFCVFLFSRKAAIREVLSVLPMILDDPEHPMISLGEQIRSYAASIYRCNSLFPVCVLMIAVLLAAGYRSGALIPCLIATCLVCTALEINILREFPYLNCVMFPINLAAPFCAVHCRSRSVRIPFFGIWVPGGVYTFCIFLSSNQKFLAISSASTVMTAASIVMLCAAASELTEREAKSRKTRVLLLSVLLLLSVQFYAEISLRYSSVFWEADGMAAQTITADSGPERGIRMTPERMEQYQRMLSDVSAIRNRKGLEKLLFLSEETVPYLMAEKDISSYSAWLAGVNRQSIERLDAYFSLYPDKVPDGIYIDPAFQEYLDHWLTQEYRTETLPSGALLLTRKSS